HRYRSNTSGRPCRHSSRCDQPCPLRRIMLDLSKFHERIKHVEPITEFGTVEKVVGNTIESHGPNVTMGCVCWLENQGRRIPVEVVGFTDGKVIAMPL